MSHSVSETAARAVKNSQRKIEEKRTPEQIIKDLRLNVKNRLYVAPLDIELLLALYDEATAGLGFLKDQLVMADGLKISQLAVIRDLQAKNEEFRSVYEQENRTLRVVYSPAGVVQMTEELSTPGRIVTDLHEHEHGGEA